MRYVHGLAFHPPEMALVKQEECTGNVKRDLFRICLKYKTDDRPVVGFKGGTLDRDLLKELKIPYLDLEKLGGPKFKEMMR